MSGKIRKMKGVAGKRRPSWPRPVTQIHPEVPSAGMTEGSEGQEIPVQRQMAGQTLTRGCHGVLAPRVLKLRQRLTLGNLGSTDSRKACGFVPVNSFGSPRVRERKILRVLVEGSIAIEVVFVVFCFVLFF